MASNKRASQARRDWKMVERVARNVLAYLDRHAGSKLGWAKITVPIEPYIEIRRDELVLLANLVTGRKERKAP